MAKGMSADKANSYFDYVKSTGTDNDEIYAEAANELKWLADTKAAKDAQIEQQNAQNAQIEQQRYNDYWGVSVDEQGQMVKLNKEGSIYNIIESGVIKS